MKADWTKAPYWALAWAQRIYKHETDALYFAWVGLAGYHYNPKLEGDAVVCRPFGGGNNFRDFKVLELRPAITERPWHGQGFPPVGTNCEVQLDNGKWKPCEVVAQKGCRFIAFVDSITAVVISKSGLFRVRRTAEQIAAEERMHSAVALYQAVMNQGGEFDRIPKERQEHYLKLVDEGWQKVPRA